MSRPMSFVRASQDTEQRASNHSSDDTVIIDWKWDIRDTPEHVAIWRAEIDRRREEFDERRKKEQKARMRIERLSPPGRIFVSDSKATARVKTESDGKDDMITATNPEEAESDDDDISIPVSQPVEADSDDDDVSITVSQSVKTESDDEDEWARNYDGRSVRPYGLQITEEVPMNDGEDADVDIQEAESPDTMRVSGDIEQPLTVLDSTVSGDAGRTKPVHFHEDEEDLVRVYGPGVFQYLSEKFLYLLRPFPRRSIGHDVNKPFFKQLWISPHNGVEICLWWLGVQQLTAGDHMFNKLALWEQHEDSTGRPIPTDYYSLLDPSTEEDRFDQRYEDPSTTVLHYYRIDEDQWVVDQGLLTASKEFQLLFFTNVSTEAKMWLNTREGENPLRLHVVRPNKKPLYTFYVFVQEGLPAGRSTSRANYRLERRFCYDRAINLKEAEQMFAFTTILNAHHSGYKIQAQPQGNGFRLRKAPLLGAAVS